MAKQVTQETREELIALQERRKTVIPLDNGGTVSIGYTMPYTQDKINSIIVHYEHSKKAYEGQDERLNHLTRQFYAQCAAAILMKSYFGLKLFWALRWRWMYYFGKFTGDDYLRIVLEAKKKAQEQEYSLAMALMMDMTTMWTIMTKKEAEEYHRELELVRKAQSLKSSQD